MTKSMSMELQEVAEYVWRNSHAIEFGSSGRWIEDIFLHPWFKEFHPDEWIKGSDRPGWYWFSIIDAVDLTDLDRPVKLPEKACDFGDLSSENYSLFENELSHLKRDNNVIYNGHEANVIGRIRSHFAVNNNKTGALGISHYDSLSNCHWVVNVFVKQHLELEDDLSPEDKAQIKKLCESKTGRVSIEQMWRSMYGWPALCKA